MTCSVIDCGKPRLARGLCSAHYHQRRRGNDLALRHSDLIRLLGELARYVPRDREDLHQRVMQAIGGA